VEEATISHIVFKDNEVGWACGEERKVYRVLVGKPEGQRPLGKPRCRREDGIRMDLRKMGWRGMDCIQLAQDSRVS
jgi:hypothetical protein